VRYVIVGSSAAGIAAVEAIRRSDERGSVTVVSDEPSPLYSRCLLSYYLAGTIDASGLAYRSSEFFGEMRVDARLSTKAESVDVSRQVLVCERGAEIPYDQLLIATGASAKIPRSIPAVKGVFVLRTIADAVAIRATAESAHHAVVLGGGLIGMKAAFGLSKRGLHVTVIVRSRYVLSQMIDADAARIVMDGLREHGISVLTGADVAGTDVRDGRLIGVTLDPPAEGGGSLPCDILIVAKGVQANCGLVEGTGIECHAGIVTDSTQRTNIENVFAAGDVAETLDAATGERSVNALWTCAVQQGKTAGFNMAGRERRYDGSLGMNSINFPGADLISFGVTNPPADSDYEVLVDRRVDQGVYKKLVLRENRVKGLILVNRIDAAGVLLSLLRSRADVSGFEDALLSDRFSYAQILALGGRTEWNRYRTASNPIGSG